MLEARDVTFSYGKAAPVLSGVSLSVAPGERVALVAPSGAGKTTLCRLLAGYEQPRSGTVLVDGTLLPRRGRCPVQLVGQHPELALDPRMVLGASLAEALGEQVDGRCGQQRADTGDASTGGDRAGKEGASHKDGAFAEASVEEAVALEAAAPAWATNRSAPWPAGLKAHEELLGRFGIQRRWLSRYPRELSGGELQRLCLVRALLARPAYLVADEMTASLDAIAQAQLWRELLAELERNAMGLVFTTHSPALAQRLATRTVRWDDAG